ncbi:hypothetical protein LCGC14_1926290 [marine sediment metagenome]|uniref:Uncharacterized protein n=1 Tax=marine sediment metagenome TaxID=412755 RepID=A0A0F9FP84_9ZZZZ|nr:hypothetical protein [bacterium]
MTECPMCEKGELFTPEGVLRRVDLHCTKCGEIYIPGTRIEETTEMIREILTDLENGVKISHKKYISEEDLNE